MVLGQEKPSLMEKFNVLGHVWPLVAVNGELNQLVHFWEKKRSKTSQNLKLFSLRHECAT